MSYLLDTDVVSAYTKRTIPAKLEQWLAVHEGESFLSVVSLAEMRHGLPGIADKDYPVMAERVAKTEIVFLQALEPLDVDVLIRWKKLLVQLKTINRTMTCEDSLLAATALHRNHVLATINERHFAPAAQFGLTVENPLT